MKSLLTFIVAFILLLNIPDVKMAFDYYSIIIRLFVDKYETLKKFQILDDLGFPLNSQLFKVRNGTISLPLPVY